MHTVLIPQQANLVLYSLFKVSSFLCILFRLSSIQNAAIFMQGFFFCHFWVFFFCFLRPLLWHIEVSRLGFKSELQLPAYAAVTEMQDPSCVCNLHHSSQQCWIPGPLSEARDRTYILMDTSWISFCCAATGTPLPDLFRSEKKKKGS